MRNPKAREASGLLTIANKILGARRGGVRLDRQYLRAVAPENVDAWLHLQPTRCVSHIGPMPFGLRLEFENERVIARPKHGPPFFAVGDDAEARVRCAVVLREIHRCAAVLSGQPPKS